MQDPIVIKAPRTTVSDVSGGALSLRLFMVQRPTQPAVLVPSDDLPTFTRLKLDGRLKQQLNVDQNKLKKAVGDTFKTNRID